MIRTAAVVSPNNHEFDPRDGLTCRNSFVTEFERDNDEISAGDAAKNELVQLYTNIVDKLNDPDLGVDLIGNNDF